MPFIAIKWFFGYNFPLNVRCPWFAFLFFSDPMTRRRRQIAKYNFSIELNWCHKYNFRLRWRVPSGNTCVAPIVAVAIAHHHFQRNRHATTYINLIDSYSFVWQRRRWHCMPKNDCFFSFAEMVDIVFLSWRQTYTDSPTRPWLQKGSIELKLFHNSPKMVRDAYCNANCDSELNSLFYSSVDSIDATIERIINAIVESEIYRQNRFNERTHQNAMKQNIVEHLLTWPVNGR